MKIKYPLLSNAFSKKDIDIGIKVLKSKFITMSKYTESFEKAFAKKLNFKYALMTNSGSSANLLAMSALVNPIRKKRLRKNDHVLIPAVCWSTSLWPIIQNGLKPVFVDVDLNTFNISLEDLQRKITKKTKAIMCIHILGTSTNMQKLSLIAKKNNLTIIEDTCESLGTKYKKNFLGSFGDFGTFSFYYSHQITSGEGGMIVCKTKEDYEILFALRSHGWLGGTRFYKRNLNKYNMYAKKNPKLDPRYIFINSGFNLRPTDIQAAIANNQFKRLEVLKRNREINRKLIINKLKKSKLWNNQFEFIYPAKKISPSWMGLPILLSNKFKYKKKKFINFLDRVGIETRPIISGSFINQPASKLYNLNPKNEKFENAQIIQDLGFIIGLHTKKISYKQLNFIHDNFFMIDKI